MYALPAQATTIMLAEHVAVGTNTHLAAAGGMLLLCYVRTAGYNGAPANAQWCVVSPHLLHST